MLGAFLGKGIDACKLFDHLKISTSKKYRENLNKHDVIYIDFSKMPNNCNSYSQYINRIEKKLKKDLLAAFPECDHDQDDALWDISNIPYDLKENLEKVLNIQGKSLVLV